MNGSSCIILKRFSDPHIFDLKIVLCIISRNIILSIKQGEVGHMAKFRPIVDLAR